MADIKEANETTSETTAQNNQNSPVKAEKQKRAMTSAVNDLKDPKGDLYCLVRQFYAGDKINPSFDNCGELGCC